MVFQISHSLAVTGVLTLQCNNVIVITQITIKFFRKALDHSNKIMYYENKRTDVLLVPI